MRFSRGAIQLQVTAVKEQQQIQFGVFIGFITVDIFEQRLFRGCAGKQDTARIDGVDIQRIASLDCHHDLTFSLGDGAGWVAGGDVNFGHDLSGHVGGLWICCLVAGQAGIGSILRAVICKIIGGIV